MNRWKQQIGRLATYAVTVAIGSAIGVYATRSREGRPPEAYAAPEAHPDPPGGPGPSLQGAPAQGEGPGLHELKERVADLERRSTDAGVGAPAAPSLAAQLPDADGERRKREAFRQALLDRHANEGRDPKWSQPAERSLQGELADLSPASGAAVKKVDCGTTVCVASLQWPDYSSARKGFRSTLDHGYAVNCGHAIFLPPPRDPASAYEADLIFDCEGFRSESQ
jgi:hypothetical protein